MSSATILVVDDEADLRRLLGRTLELEGYAVLSAADAERALETLQKQLVDVVITDVRMPGMSGVDLVREVKAAYPHTEIICLTAYGRVSDGVEAMRLGAYDFLEKDNYRSKIIPVLARATEKAQLNREVRSLRAKVNGAVDFNAIVGQSAPLRAAVHLARRVAPTDAAVLLLGPTGSGKEVFARAIHAAGGRAANKLVALNCAALGKDLLESELFGYKAGAFTGALKDKPGLVTTADGGTLFLDEIGEMEPALQAKLLRVLESGTFIPLGDTKERRVDLRIIAATNRDLATAAASGEFRSDLYYRLSTFVVEIPGLAERPEDIPDLVNFFIARLTKGTPAAERPVASDAFLNALRTHAWPGNVRELRNVVERAIILADGPYLEASSLPFASGRTAVTTAPTASLAAVEAAHIRRVVAHFGGDKPAAAASLGIGLTTLYAKLKEQA